MIISHMLVTLGASICTAGRANASESFTATVALSGPAAAQEVLLPSLSSGTHLALTRALSSPLPEVSVMVAPTCTDAVVMVTAVSERNRQVSVLARELAVKRTVQSKAASAKPALSVVVSKVTSMRVPSAENMAVGVQVRVRVRVGARVRVRVRLTCHTRRWREE